ncbi:MAG: TonB-dependent receptor [Acidobacteria bacterium]|nr:TonB-dependent receptor [Acidobacteriota bacterium]
MRLLTLLATLTLGMLSAQTTTSTITGSLKDPSNAVIPNASLTISNLDSGVSVPAQSNDAGLYRVSGLIPGSYKIEVVAQGFQKLVRTGITVQISQTLQVDLTLQVGDVRQTVDVSTSAPVLDTQSSSQGQLVERNMIEGMPMPNRTSTALLALIPGASIQNVSGDIPIFSVAGGRTRNQQFTLDGGNHTNTVGLAVNQSQVPLPMDAMQEFRVLSNSYSAEYGQSQSGVVTLATRSGTNKWHGNLFEYFRNESIDARNFFAATRPKFRQNQFGGSLGGPIRRNRTHFFTTYERTQQVTGGTALWTVPTPLQRSGDFSRTLNAQGQQILIFDPATTQGNTRLPFPNNVVPSGRIDPVARNTAAFWPDPNLPGTVTGANNFTLNTRPSLNRNIIVARGDHQINSRNQLMVRYFYAGTDQDNPGVTGKPQADPLASITEQRTDNILGSWTSNLRPSLLSDFRWGLVRREFANYRYGRDEDFAGKLGLRGVSAAGFPIFGVAGFQGLGGAPYRFSNPLLDYQIQESISWYRGRHAIKFGMEVRLGIFNDDTDTSSSGNFSIGPQLTSRPGTAGTGNGFATFLLGEVDSANTIRPDTILSRASYWGVYVQDDYRITDKLTLNLGLRWEATTPRTEDNNRMNAFDMTAINPVSRTPGVITFAGRNGVPRTAFDLDRNNYGPRAGLAWNLLPRTVIRGGGGFIYGSAVNSIVGTAAALGFSTDLRITTTQIGIASAMTLRNGFPAVSRVPVDQLGAGFGAVPPGAATNTAVTFFERNRPVPVSYQYNLGIQHELIPNLLIEVSYIGNLSRKLTAPDLPINQVPPSLMGPGNAQARRPFPQFTNVTLINPALGSSSYHGGFVKVERRYSRGLSLLAHYTFSRFLDDVESFSEIGDAGSYMNFYDRRLDKGPSGSDIRHRAVLSGVYDLPFLQNRGWLTRVFGGWRAGLIGSLQSGPTFTVFSFVNETNAFTPGANRADIIGQPRLPGSERTLLRWFNTSAFANPAPFRFGTSGRGIMNGPGLVNIDSSFAKRIPIREKWRAELRAEFFNLLNQTNFNLPGRSVGAPTFGVINSARPARSGQLAFRLDF